MRATEKPMTQGASHWTHRRPDLVPRGEQRYNARLTVARVLELRAARLGGDTFTELAERFGVTVKHAWEIATRRKWRHVP